MTWFQPPRLRIGEESHAESRRATWLELFFDLIFVVAVSQLAHNLSKDTTINGFLNYLLLFVPVWWAWVGATLYANRFDVDDIGHRLLTGVQMLAIAGMAVNVHDGLAHSSIGFAVCYIVIRLMLVLQYLRVAQNIPKAKPMAVWYASGFAIAALLWLISLWVPPPMRFGLWILGILVDLLTPVTGAHLQANLLPHFEHLPERFGLFVIIVLGEAIIAVVNGISEKEWEVMSVLFAVLGFAIAFSLWWLYFENVGSTALQAAGAAGQIRTIQIWLYGHLPLVVGVAAAGVGVEHVILCDPTQAFGDADRWLLCGSIALCLFSLAVLHRTGVIFQCKARTRYRACGAISLILLAVIGHLLLPVIVVGIVAIVMVIQVAQDLYQGHPSGWKAMNEI